MMRMTTKLIRNAMYEGQSATRPAHRSWSPCGTRISRISSVIAMAKTPSLNASTREGLSVMRTKMLFLGRFCTNHNRPGFMHRATLTLPFALIAAGLTACSNSSGPAVGFECLGQALPTTAPAIITVTGQVKKNVLSPNALGGAYVFAFRTGDTTTLAADTSNTPGFYSLTITTGGTPVNGYVRVTDSAHISTYAYPAVPLAAGTPVAGATVSSTPAGTVRYNAGGVPSSTATSTADDGVAYIANVAAGDVTVKASASGHTLRQHVVNAHADAITLTQIQP